MDKNTITGLVLIGNCWVEFSFWSRPGENQKVAKKNYHIHRAGVQQQEKA